MIYHTKGIVHYNTLSYNEDSMRMLWLQLQQVVWMYSYIFLIENVKILTYTIIDFLG